MVQEEMAELIIMEEQIEEAVAEVVEGMEEKHSQ
jgi:hypothetical protein